VEVLQDLVVEYLSLRVRAGLHLEMVACLTSQAEQGQMEMVMADFSLSLVGLQMLLQGHLVQEAQ
jgi:hypothetical protein